MEFNKQLSGWVCILWASQVALVVKKPPANTGDIRDVVSIPGLERSPGVEHGNPLQYSCLENRMDRWAWGATVHRVAKSGTQLKWLSMHTHTCRLWPKSFAPAKWWIPRVLGMAAVPTSLSTDALSQRCCKSQGQLLPLSSVILPPRGRVVLIAGILYLAFPSETFISYLACERC